MTRKPSKDDAEEWGPGRFEDDWLGEGFVQIPRVVLFNATITAGAKALYGILCWYIWSEKRVPPQAQLARDLGGVVRTVSRHLAELEETGYIERVRRGLGRPNEYIVKSLARRRTKMSSLDRHRSPIRVDTKVESPLIGLDSPSKTRKPVDPEANRKMSRQALAAAELAKGKTPEEVVAALARVKTPQAEAERIVAEAQAMGERGG